ncbi:hypothetical protein Salmuc_01652 [Salipiger mucosus DSM 16094]|uniref:Uncharacterized protein n=1 Tax=Salipiger mucosus DSM 16094 TaxID=1123237 RepID=S9QWA2_9RHOB|nr:hypothetical protein Salmuc_01652 [Salipiger mucosus DSM 16094]
MDFYAPQQEVEAAFYAHTAELTVHNAHLDEVVDKLATSGYRDRDGRVFIHFVTVGDRLDERGRATEILHEISDDDAVWSGGLTGTAQERFDATPEGGVFGYRNKPLTRLTSSEITDLVGGRQFALRLPGDTEECTADEEIEYDAEPSPYRL